MASFSGTVRGGSLNLRQSCNTSSTKLASIPNGTSLTVATVSGFNDWFQTSYNGQTGYVVAQYIAVTSGVSTCTVTTSSGSLNIRKTPSTSATVLYTAAKNSTLYVLDDTSVSGWYRVSSSSGTGWASSSYLTIGSSGGESGSATYHFYSNDAVTYALNHSENSTGVCKKRNTTFSSIDGKDDCADFVHQCICAGGVPMFNGWFYRLSGIPSAWSDSKWTLTYSGLQKLLAKSWVTEVNYNSIQPGDMIYSYDESASPTPYTHVTIAVSYNVTKVENNKTKFGCNVCGCTSNQRDAFKELTASNCKCYRVKATLVGDGTEKEVDIPLSGNGATVL